MNKELKPFIPIIIIAVALVLVIMFLPIFKVWGGTTNLEFGSDDENFFDVIEFVFGGKEYMSYNMWVVQFTLAAIIPAFVLLISSICKSKVMCIISSLAGVAGMAFMLIRYCSDSSYNAEHLFGEYSSISMGTWIVTALFVVALIVSIAIKKRAKAN